MRTEYRMQKRENRIQNAECRTFRSEGIAGVKVLPMQIRKGQMWNTFQYIIEAVSKTPSGHCEPFFGEAIFFFVQFHAGLLRSLHSLAMTFIILRLALKSLIRKNRSIRFLLPEGGTRKIINSEARNIFFLVMLTLFLPFHISFASDPIPAPKQERPIVLIGGTIHTVSGPVIEHGMVMFEKGKIVNIGISFPLPKNVERIDVTGKHLYPGIISAASEIGLTEIEAVRATLDQSETGRINPNVRTEIAVNPESELIPTTRANGIAIAHVIPQGGLIAGRSSVMMLDGWTNEEMTLFAPAGLYVNWPSMTISRSPFVRQSEEEQKKNIEKNLGELRDAFADARAYMKVKKADPAKHNTDVRWEAMIALFEMKIPLLVAANDMKQIQSAVQFARDQNVRLIIHGGRDAWKLTELLKEHNVSVIIGGVHKLPARRWDDYDEPFTLAKKLHDAGILFAISGEGNAAMNERNIAYQAATASAYGLPKDVALRAVTINAAMILGIDTVVGSLEIGKDATLIVTNGDPLEILTNTEMQFIQGKKIDLRSRHTQLWKKYQEKYRPLK